MSIEVSVYTEQPAMSGLDLQALARRQGFELRFLDLAGMPLAEGVSLERPLYGQGYVLIAWPGGDVETTANVEQALQRRDKTAIDELGKAGALGWFSISCAEFEFARYEALMQEDAEDEDEEVISDEVLQRMKRARTTYFFRCGTRPAQCGQWLGRVASVVREATDGFDDEP
jgi:hypothetical protein